MGDSPWKVRIRFGDTDASALLLNLQTKSSINDLATAEVVLRLDPSFAEPVELFAETKVSFFTEAGEERDLFTGDVVEVAADGEVVRVKLQSATSLTERKVPPWWGQGAGCRRADLHDPP